MASFFPQEVIRKKRDGLRLGDAEIAAMIAGIADGSVGEGQTAAFAMAVFFRGMGLEECVAMTTAMAGSGERLEWRSLNLPGPVLDKHSTGGVGDKVSLMLAPMVAAAGGFVPMISGRSLGHTGGTLDKLESIPGYAARPDTTRFRRAVKIAGCAIVGQTANMAPADRRLYAIRDITATVESIPLITSSILSKKLAAGLDVLVTDVKFGSGAFMTEFDRARELAESLATVATRSGLPTRGLLTDMNQVLGRTAGNAAEVREAVEYLTGVKREARLDAVTRALARVLLVEGKLAENEDDADRMLDRTLDRGEAAERLARMIRELGGPSDFVPRIDAYLPKAPVVRPAQPRRAGYVVAMDAAAVGRAVLALGGGRRNVADAIDHAVGLTDVAGIGEAVGSDRPLALIHARTESDAAAAEAALSGAVSVGDTPPPARPPIAAKV
jgi:thymidine phosphorylase